MAVSELVVGISLGSPARMRFRRYPPKRRERSIAMARAPRSIYRLESEGALGVAAQNPADAGAAIFHHVSNAAGSAAPKLS
jgi:hypothetical protein